VLTLTSRTCRRCRGWFLPDSCPIQRNVPLKLSLALTTSKSSYQAPTSATVRPSRSTGLSKPDRRAVCGPYLAAPTAHVGTRDNPRWPEMKHIWIIVIGPGWHRCSNRLLNCGIRSTNRQRHGRFVAVQTARRALTDEMPSVRTVNNGERARTTIDQLIAGQPACVLANGSLKQKAAPLPRFSAQMRPP
jgi:hypothetical protein